MAKQLQTHEGYGGNRDTILMTLPLLLMSFFFYGPRVILLAVVAVVAARLCDRAACAMRSQRYDKTENSSVAIALILVLMMPVTVRFRVVVAGVVVAVLVAKAAFGGFPHYPFNPAAVGFCVVSVSWPAEMLRYPAPQNWMLNGVQTFEQLWRTWSFEGAPLLEGPSYILKNGGLPKLDTWTLLLGDYAGPIGTTACLVILACAYYLFIRKRLPLVAPVSFLATLAVIAFVFPRFTEIGWQTWPWDILQRLHVVKYELLSGALLFVAVFMVDEPATLPKNQLSRLVYGVLLGIATMMFRYFGTYELGACFAILLVNATSGYFDRAIARGAVHKKGGAKA